MAILLNGEFRASGMKDDRKIKKIKLKKKKSQIFRTFWKTASVLTQRANIYSKQLNH